jgi:hypothetical protein
MARTKAKTKKPKLMAIKLEGYIGEGSSIICDPDPMYLIIDITNRRVDDYGYPSMEAAEAVIPKDQRLDSR